MDFVHHIYVFTLVTGVVICCNSEVSLTVRHKQVIKPLTHIWTSTGLCPPMPHSNSSQYFLSSGMLQNLQLIESLPYMPYSFQVRIHWLLDLIVVQSTTKHGELMYNFTTLDQVVERMVDNKIRIGFELMGNPSNFFNDFENETQIHLWAKLISKIVYRYRKYAVEHAWNFESWNEPDHGDFDGFNFTTQGYLNYFDACEKGVHDVDPHAIFGGPGASCRLSKFSKLCWALLDHVTHGKNYFTGNSSTRLDFISIHKKGAKRGLPGNSTYIITSELATLKYLLARYPRLRNVDIFNDEGDPVTGWNQPMPFRADARYPAMVTKIIHEHLYDQHVELQNFRMLSNDNAFLSYAPHIFTLRTLFARFQVNNTKEPFEVLISKPIYEVMSMLAFLNGNLINNTISGGNGLIGAISSQNMYELCITIWASNDTVATPGKPFHIILSILGVQLLNKKYVLRKLDNSQNTYDVWRHMGSPYNLTQGQIEALWNTTMISSTGSKSLNSNTIKLAITIPSVVQILVCQSEYLELSTPTNLSFHRVSHNIVLILWDNELQYCFDTYDVEYALDNLLPFQKLNKGVVLRKSMQWSSANGVQGYYRVRSRNILGQKSRYSAIRYYEDM